MKAPGARVAEAETFQKPFIHSDPLSPRWQSLR